MLPANDATAIKLIPANQYSLEQLVEIYNQTRVDYLVPMPMNAARLYEYIKTYDVKLEHSLVATLSNGQKLGVVMLGVRYKRVWITRLGVIPNTRRNGIGQALLNGAIEQAKKLSIQHIMLEVIKNNTPAQKLFNKFGFQEAGELLILRRPPLSKTQYIFNTNIKTLDHQQTLTYLKNNIAPQTWTHQYESFSNANEISGLHVSFDDGTQGWMAYQQQKHLLSRFAMKTENGDPMKVARALLSHVHQQHPRLDTQVENIRANNPHLPAFYEIGYIESFRRIEMWLDVR